MPLLDTREKRVGDLTGTLISDIVLQLFSYVAQMEREMNHQRTLEGITAAWAAFAVMMISCISRHFLEEFRG